MSRILVEPLFRYLKELSGYFSGNVRNTSHKPNNILLTYSKSGGLTTFLEKYRRDEVLKQVIQNKDYLLISDCWAGRGGVKICKELNNYEENKINDAALDVHFKR